VRSQEASESITMDRYDYIRAAGQVAVPPSGEPLLRNLGSPVLPQLTNGQPPPGGQLAPVPPKPAPAPAAPNGTPPPAGVQPGAAEPARPAAPPIQK
jgi:general secretion pathway protein D